MENSLLGSLHNIMRWVVLLFGILTLLKSFSGLGGKREFGPADKRIALFFQISVDIQLLLGLALYFMRGYFKAFSSGNMGGIMKDDVSRFWTIEHITGMIIAIILVHVGYKGTKGNRTSKAKFSRLFWCCLIALIIMLVTIPWPFRQLGIGRPWLPGMGV